MREYSHRSVWGIVSEINKCSSHFASTSSTVWKALGGQGTRTSEGSKAE